MPLPKPIRAPVASTPTTGTIAISINFKFKFEFRGSYIPKDLRSNGYLNGTILKLTSSISGKYNEFLGRKAKIVGRISASNPKGQ